MPNYETDNPEWASVEEISERDQKEILDEAYASYLKNESELTEAQKHGLPTLDREEWEHLYSEMILRGVVESGQ